MTLAVEPQTSSLLRGGLPTTELLKLAVVDTDLLLSPQCNYFLQKNYLSLLEFHGTLLETC